MAAVYKEGRGAPEGGRAKVCLDEQPVSLQFPAPRRAVSVKLTTTKGPAIVLYLLHGSSKNARVDKREATIFVVKQFTFHPRID